MDQTRRQARIAGVLYLILGIFGGFSMGYFQPLFYVAGDPAATASRIATHLALIPWGVFADLVQVTAFLFLALQLSWILKSSGEKLAQTFLVLVSISVGIMALNNAFLLAAQELRTNAEIAYALVSLQHWGALTAQLFFGLWLIPFGILAWKSKKFPAWLGILLIAGGIGYVVNLATLVLTPAFGAVLGPFVVAPAAIAEISTVLYLLIVGVRVPKTA